MTLLEKLKQYRQLRKEILVEFDATHYDDIEDHTDEYFCIAGTNECVWYDDEPFDDPDNATYCTEVARHLVKRKSGLVFSAVRLSTGDKTAFIFDETKEIKE